jgi:hypothetical protein
MIEKQGYKVIPVIDANGELAALSRYRPRGMMANLSNRLLPHEAGYAKRTVLVLVGGPGSEMPNGLAR